MKSLTKSVAGLALLSGLVVGNVASAATPLTSILLSSTKPTVRPAGTQVSPNLLTAPLPSNKIVPTGIKPPNVGPEGCGPRP